jgi:hypothetical protein
MSLFPYPIAMPPMPPGPKQIRLAQNFVVARNDSPFTSQQQVYEHQGSWWSVQVDLPYLTRAQASPWLAFLSALNGKSGTFLFGDPTVLAPLGSAGGSPSSSVAGQTGKTLSIINLSGTLKAGDLFQIGGENRLLFSQAFENAAWVYANCTRPTADTIVAPDGSTTAEALAFTASGSSATVLQVLSNLMPGQTYTFSCWLKAAAGTPTLSMAIADIALNSNLVNTAKTMSTGWQRFSVSFVASSGASGWQALLWSPSAAVTFHAWGAQIELGIPPTVAAGPGSDYYPTTSAAQQSTRRLHMNQADASGTPITLNIFPRLRESPVTLSESGWLYFVNPQGQFRLDANLFQYTVDTAGHYSISFNAIEAF